MKEVNKFFLLYNYNVTYKPASFIYNKISKKKGNKIMKIRENVTIVSGYIANDPFVNEAKNMFAFGLGIDKSYFDQKKKEWVNNTAWVNVKLFSTNTERIEKLAERVTSGCSVLVNGRIDQNSYEKDGNKYNEVFINANSIQILDVGNSDSEDSNTSFLDGIGEEDLEN